MRSDDGWSLLAENAVIVLIGLFHQLNSNVIQQWMEALKVRREIRAISGHTVSRAFDTVWHHALLSKLSADGIQGQLHTWLTDFLHSRSQRVVLNGILSSPLPVKAGLTQGSVLSPVVFLIFINYLTLWKIQFRHGTVAPPVTDANRWNAAQERSHRVKSKWQLHNSMRYNLHRKKNLCTHGQPH